MQSHQPFFFLCATKRQTNQKRRMTVNFTKISDVDAYQKSNPFTNTSTKKEQRPSGTITMRESTPRNTEPVHITTVLREFFGEGDVVVPRWMMWLNLALLGACVLMLIHLVQKQK